jgi:L-gulono-1,4-lactone dehydrogenase
VNRWRNWARTSRCTPAQLLRPRSEEEVVAAVRVAARDGLTVRAAGTGHSFNSIVTTDGMVLDLTGFRGVVAVSEESVTVRPGTTIQEICRVLDGKGLALPNIGTLHSQSIAGAVSTGNHGTGLAHPALAGEILALRLVTAAGEVLALDGDSDPDLFRAAKTSLGALGVLTEVTLRCVPAFRLRLSTDSAPLPEVADRLPEILASGDHVQTSWLAWKDRVGIRTATRTDEPPTPRTRHRQYTTTMEELRCGVLGQIGRINPGLMGAIADGLSGRAKGPYTGVSHHVYTFPQPVKLMAMEHAIPLADAGVALRELSGILRRCAVYSPYSLLIRSSRGDDVPLSPSYGRDTAYVNLTIPRTAGYLELLRAIEPPLRDLGGRPHWGKAHTATAGWLSTVYPEWDLFQQVRAKLDPEGRFVNDHLTRVLGPVR